VEQYSRRELLDAFVNFTGTEGDSDQRLYAAQVLRRAYLSLWLAHPWNDHRLPSPISITTVASARTYALPEYFGRLPPRVTELRNLTSGERLALLSLDDLQQAYPTTGTTLESAGVPRVAAIGGSVGVRVQPTGANGQALEVVSTSVDDQEVKVTIEGIADTGVWDEIQVALAGQIAVPAGAWREVINFTKAYPDGVEPTNPDTSSEGDITLQTTIGGVVLQTLLPEESARECPSLIVYPKPETAGEIIGIPAIRGPKRLLYDSDEIPRYWSEALLERMKQLSKVSDGDPGSLLPLGPEAIKLVAFDNGQQTRIRTRPFRG